MGPVSGFASLIFRKAEILLRYPKNLHITIRKVKIQNPKTKKTPNTLIDIGYSGSVPIVGTEKPSVYWGFRVYVGNRVGNGARRDAIQKQNRTSRLH